MYACHQCSTPIHFMTVWFSSPAFPIACKACGAEQCKPGSHLLANLGWGALMWIGLLVAAIAALFVDNDVPFFLWFGGLAGAMTVVETRHWRAGTLLPVSPGRKRQERIAIFLFSALVVAFVVLLFTWVAWPRGA